MSLADRGERKHSTPHSFANIFDAREIAETRRCDFDEHRPNSALGYQTPKEFVASLKINRSQSSAA